MTSLSAMECLASPQAACVASPNVFVPFAMLVLLVVAGFMAWQRDVTAFRRARRRAALAAAFVLVPALLAIGGFFVFDPDAVYGTETSAASQTGWVAAVSLAGAGAALALGVLAMALGGRIAKWMNFEAGGRAKSRRATGLIIAIDGPAASGKGTLAKRIAQHFSLPCLDTGLLYRAVARDVIEAGHHLTDTAAAVAAAKGLNAATLDDPALRGPVAGDAASIVARIAEVRAALLDYQRRFAAQPGGAVLDGRDIGTVVCPNARIKIYVTATAEERARRRHIEHTERGETIDYDVVLSDIRRRDARDSGRDIAPMAPATDALRLDTTTLNANEAFRAALALIETALKR